MRLRFYYSERDSLQKSLFQILKKAVEQDKRVVVALDPQADIQALDRFLWTYDPLSFLAHGYLEEDSPLDCPIWLTREEKNLNGATVLIGFDHIPSAFESYRQVCFILAQPLGQEQILWWQEFCRERDYSLVYYEKIDRWQPAFRFNSG